MTFCNGNVIVTIVTRFPRQIDSQSSSRLTLAPHRRAYGDVVLRSKSTDLMDKLPCEVLTDIFLKTITVDYDRGVRLFNEFNLRPLRVSHVCRRWREIAISYRYLWSYFCMSVQSRPADILATFDLFQERSSGAPLYFDIHFSFIDLDFVTKPGKDAFNSVEYVILALAQQQHRWVEARLYWENGTERKRITELFLAKNMPMLRTLYLWTLETTTIYIDTHKCPKLERIDVSGGIVLWTGGEPETSQLLQCTLSGSLTFFDIRSIRTTARSCLDFLQIAPFLEKLRITFRSYNANHRSDGPAAPASPVVHPKLRCLQLVSGLGLLLGQIVLPSLTALDLEGSMKDVTLINFFQRSTPPLTFLRIDCYDNSENTIIDVLRLLPTLREFYLLHVRITARFFQELTVLEAGDTGVNSLAAAPCPELEVIGVIPQFQLELDHSAEYQNAFVTMLESRARHLGTFPKVTFVRDRESRKIDTWELRKTPFGQDYLISGFFAGPDGRPDDYDSKTEQLFRHTIIVGNDEPSNVFCSNRWTAFP